MGHGAKGMTREGAMSATFAKAPSSVHTVRTGPLRDAMGRVIKIVDFK